MTSMKQILAGGLVIAALVFQRTNGLAQESTNAAPVVNETPVVETAPAVVPVAPDAEEESTKVKAAGDGLIDVTVENESLENVVKMFTHIANVNIVTTSAQLEGSVTVNLRGVQWKDALQTILSVHNLALEERLPGSSVYSIVPKPAQDAMPLKMETIVLHFTTVGELGPIVQSMLPAITNASLTQMASRNAMVVRTTEGNMREIKDLVAQMDVPGRQVVVETKFMELSDSASKKLGINWQSLDAFQLTALPGRPGGVAMGYDKERTQLQNTEENFRLKESSTETDRRYDKDGNQIQNASAPAPISGTDPLEFYEEINPSVTDTSTDTTRSQARTGKEITDVRSAVLTFDEFNVVLSALKKTEGVSVVSNPKMIVASGSKDAYFTVGEREPIIKTEVERGTEESPGDLLTAQLDTSINTDYIKQGYLETGIQLNVVPVVKTDDLIEAMIEPRLVRRILPDKVVGENSWPRIAVKELKTSFTLRSGQTVAIGGLTDTSDGKKVAKVPLLGDIPLIGKYLFSHTEDTKSQIETIIFVTLSLAEPEALYQEAGVPDQATLVHKKLIRSRGEREDFEAELETLQKAADAASAEKAKARAQK